MDAWDQVQIHPGPRHHRSRPAASCEGLDWILVGGPSTQAVAIEGMPGVTEVGHMCVCV